MGLHQPNPAEFSPGSRLYEYPAHRLPPVLMVCLTTHSKGWTRVLFGDEYLYVSMPAFVI